MALSGLDIYKLLPKTNCRECGFPTCLAFAMQLAKKAISLDKCPHVTDEAKLSLEASSQPPIKLITIGCGDKKVEIGNETVMFRHEEKFHHPTAIGFIIDDSLKDDEILERISKIEKLSFDRVGQTIEVNLIAIRQNSTASRFIEVLKLVTSKIDLGVVLISNDLNSQKEALNLLKDKNPLLFPLNDEITESVKLAAEFKASLVVAANDLDEMHEKSSKVNSTGLSNVILSPKNASVTKNIWELNQMRKLALKKSNRTFGFPTLVCVEDDNPYDEAVDASAYISKYASIVLLKGVESWETLSLLTLRQNIFTDPQKPLQIEPNIYAIGSVDEKSPVLITTNFSLSYYTVLGEVEASKIPTYIISIDTEGMSVLTAWAAEKFTPEQIAASLDKFELKDKISHNRLIIPGYVAVMSGDLEDKSNYQILVGPKEASGIPSFLKNLS